MGRDLLPKEVVAARAAQWRGAGAVVHRHEAAESPDQDRRLARVLLAGEVSASGDRVPDRDGSSPERAPASVLAMMRERAQVGGGSFEVQSSAGRGTTITVRFPTSLLQAETQATESSDSPSATTPAAKDTSSGSSRESVSA